MFERIPEPELMLDTTQAEQYAAADFEASHSRYPKEFAQLYPETDITGLILDIGCGPADVTVRFAALFPRARVLGVDGSTEMLRLAQKRVQYDPDLHPRVTFKETVIPFRNPIEKAELIIANGMLHHLHTPVDLWNTISETSKSGTYVFVTDLLRPDSEDEVQKLVRENCPNDHPVHVADYTNSLRAAFTPDEILEQLREAQLDEMLTITVPDKTRVIIHGRLLES
jgi:trans-aconitate methyltransferase